LLDLLDNKEDVSVSLPLSLSFIAIQQADPVMKRIQVSTKCIKLDPANVFCIFNDIQRPTKASFTFAARKYT
jgi:hypothetical protein